MEVLVIVLAERIPVGVVMRMVWTSARGAWTVLGMGGTVGEELRYLVVLVSVVVIGGSRGVEVEVEDRVGGEVNIAGAAAGKNVWEKVVG